MAVTKLKRSMINFLKLIRFLLIGRKKPMVYTILRNYFSRPFLCVALLVISYSTSFFAEPQLHVCTVASYKSKGLHQLLGSCERNHIKIDILGMGLPYNGNSEKLIYVREYVKNLPNDDIVLFVDAFDVLFLEGKDAILRKFFTMKKPFVISVEKTCAPYKQLADQFPESPTSFRYLNSGTYIGYVWAIKDILDDLGEIKHNVRSDQGILTMHYLAHPEKYFFDYYCELFLPVMDVKEAELLVDVNNFAVKCLETGRNTSIIHGNGQRGRILYQRLYDYLFLKIEDRYFWKTVD